MKPKIEKRIEAHELRAKEHLTSILEMLSEANGNGSMSDTAIIEIGLKIEKAQETSVRNKPPTLDSTWPAR